MTQLAVIGGGLVGCVAAIHLKRRGLDVTVFERSGDPRVAERRTRPSVNITLCERGMRVLRRARLLDAVLPLAVPAYGRIIHAAGGATSYEPYGTPDQALYSVSRNRLNGVLLDAAEAEGIPIEFDSRCLDIDSRSGDVALAGPAGERRIRADAILAADGSFSAVRFKLLRRDRFDYVQHFHDQGYRELRIPPGPGGMPVLEPHALHFWPRGRFMAVAFPNADRSFTLFIQLPFSGETSFDSLTNERDVWALFSTGFPEVLPFVADAAPAFLAQRANSMVTIRCWPWSADGRVLLIGDAAHAILPSYGQGANAGFEDCAVLDELVERCGGDWAAVCQAFERRRKPDMDAIADLCYSHFAELHVNGLDRQLERRRGMERRVHALLPELFVPLYSMIAFSSLPYAEARRRHLAQQAFIEELLREESNGVPPERRGVPALAARLADALDGAAVPAS